MTGWDDHMPQGPAQGTLVCLPGVNSGAYLMDGAVAALPDWRVVRLNTPGEGSTPLQPFSVGAYATLARQTLDKLDVTGPVVLLGHSLGGYAAQEFARQNPERVSRLILASTSRGQPDTAHDLMTLGRKVGMSFWDFQKLNETDAAAAHRHLFGPGFADREAGVFNHFLAQRAAHLPGKSATLAQLSAGGSFSSAGWVARIKCPVLVIQGGADVLVSATSAKKMAQALPDAHWLELHGVGHFPMLEHPDFWKYVATFARGGSVGEALEAQMGFLQKLWKRWNLHG
jgi:pimeloyl-ACP methyl ester carboxylesterase